MKEVSIRAEARWAGQLEKARQNAEDILDVIQCFEASFEQRSYFNLPAECETIQELLLGAQSLATFVTDIIQLENAEGGTLDRDGFFAVLRNLAKIADTFARAP